MLFQSQVFILVFAPLVLAAYYLAARSAVVRESILILASAIFYGWWDARFLPLIAGQVVFTWLIARWAGRSRWLIPLGIAANLAVLALFKYADFAVETAEALAGVELPRGGLVLPIGISFYTFEIISYLVDLRGGHAPQYGLRRFLLYVLYFPHLVAGPIIRHNELIPQFCLDPLRPGVAERIGRGAAVFVLGFVKKVFIADHLAPIADAGFQAAAGGAPGLETAWSGALAFSLQLFFDFAAYSEMAIGLGLMMGLRLPDNFAMPYRSRNLQEFWRRWHMTLSRFLRDYVYIPLGGSRAGTLRFIAAVLGTMGLCGLWHGAGWTFVAWGLFHGVGLLACRAWGGLGLALPFAASWAVTMAFVVVGWVLFRASDFGSALAMLQGMAGLGGEAPVASGKALRETWSLIALAAVISVAAPLNATFALDRLRPQVGVAVLAGAVLVIGVLAVGQGQPTNFIYFQF